MTAELLRRGHKGRIMNVVCVRYRADLAYTEQHAVLAERYPAYRYLALTTREPENEGNKMYIQDLVESGRLEEELGAPLDPFRTHVFLCGNPAMIGLPEWTEAGLVFPETLGVCQQLHERGFTIDHGKTRGNVHFEEYWTEP
jgi:ferredoxin--NADP+ reductase